MAGETSPPKRKGDDLEGQKHKSQKHGRKEEVLADVKAIEEALESTFDAENSKLRQDPVFDVNLDERVQKLEGRYTSNIKVLMDMVESEMIGKKDVALTTALITIAGAYRSYKSSLQIDGFSGRCLFRCLRTQFIIHSLPTSSRDSQ